jgi:hypothetical protein
LFQGRGSFLSSPKQTSPKNVCLKKDTSDANLTTGEKVDTPKLLPDGTGETYQMRSSAGWTHEDTSEFNAVEAHTFGTPEEMDSDRRWLARRNQARYISILANREFEERREEISDWFEVAVEKNRDYLLDAVAQGTLPGEMLVSNGAFDNSEAQGELLKQYTHPRSCPWPLWPYNRGQVRLWDHEEVSNARCYLNGKTASVWTFFYPKTANSLSQLAGCSVEDLPDVLQNWRADERYSGNSLLDRTDPMDSNLTNPWIHMTFTVVIGLSKSAFNKLLRNKGLPRRSPESWKSRYE